jgi:hypothetical protein
MTVAERILLIAALGFALIVPITVALFALYGHD